MSKKIVMKKGAKRMIAALIVILCCLFLFIYFKPSKKPEEPVNESVSESVSESVTEPVAETNTAAPDNNVKEAVEPTPEATIQESQGDLTITIPDDQESAGE